MPPTLSLSRCVYLSRCLSLSLTHTHTRARSLCLNRALSLSLAVSFTCGLSHLLSLSLVVSHSTHSRCLSFFHSSCVSHEALTCSCSLFHYHAVSLIRTHVYLFKSKVSYVFSHSFFLSTRSTCHSFSASHSLVCSLTQPLSRSLVLSLTHSTANSVCLCSLTHSFALSLNHCLSHSFFLSLVLPVTRSLSHTHSFDLSHSITVSLTPYSSHSFSLCLALPLSHSSSPSRTRYLSLSLMVSLPLVALEAQAARTANAAIAIIAPLCRLHSWLHAMLCEDHIWQHVRERTSLCERALRLDLCAAPLHACLAQAARTANTQRWLPAGLVIGILISETRSIKCAPVTLPTTSQRPSARLYWGCGVT